MTKYKILLLLALIATSLVMTVFLRRTAEVKLRENDAALHRQGQQLAGLMDEHARLSNEVVAAERATNNQGAELARLLRQVQMLQVQTNELGSQFASPRPAPATRPDSKPAPHPPEYFEQLHRRAGAKPRDAMFLSQVFALYASDHQGHFPASLDEVAPYLQKENMALSGTNQFEVLYRGSLDDLKGIPWGAVALLRDRQTWIAPSGKPARVYGLANGSSQIVESDDDFKTWEANHLFPSPPTGQ